MDSPTGSRGFSDDPGSWKTMPTLSRSGCRSLRLAPFICTPATSKLPPATGSRPSAARPIVVLPEPDSPTSPTTSPRPIVRETSSTARKTGWLPRLGYSSTRFSATRIGADVGLGACRCRSRSVRASAVGRG